jgi:hypothetical protein
MNVNLYVIEDYENETAIRLRKNKPNSNPISNAEKRTKEANKEKEGLRNFLASLDCRKDCFF